MPNTALIPTLGHLIRVGSTLREQSLFPSRVNFIAPETDGFVTAGNPTTPQTPITQIIQLQDRILARIQTGISRHNPCPREILFDDTLINYYSINPVHMAAFERLLTNYYSLNPAQHPLPPARRAALEMRLAIATQNLIGEQALLDLRLRGAPSQTKTECTVIQISNLTLQIRMINQFLNPPQTVPPNPTPAP